VKEEVL
jgi:hypothetical protein